MLLTEREINVLKMVISGMKDDQIAGRLGIKPSTVKSYKARIVLKYRKFGIRNMKELLSVFNQYEDEKAGYFLQRMHDYATAKLRLKPGGFRRHHAA